MVFTVKSVRPGFTASCMGAEVGNFPILPHPLPPPPHNPPSRKRGRKVQRKRDGRIQAEDRGIQKGLPLVSLFRFERTVRGGAGGEGGGGQRKFLKCRRQCDTFVFMESSQRGRKNLLFSGCFAPQ
jgi:hypothetical protein